MKLVLFVVIDLWILALVGVVFVPVFVQPRLYFRKTRKEIKRLPERAHPGAREPLSLGDK